MMTVSASGAFTSACKGKHAPRAVGSPFALGNGFESTLVPILGGGGGNNVLEAMDDGIGV